MSETTMKVVQRHPYHLVDPSPWPFFGGLAAFFTVMGVAMYMHFYEKGLTLLRLGFILLLGRSVQIAL